MQTTQAVLWLKTPLPLSFMTASILVCDIDSASGNVLFPTGEILEAPWSNRVVADDVSTTVALWLTKQDGTLIDGAVDCRSTT
jgi:hypothetical protein